MVCKKKLIEYEYTRSVNGFTANLPSEIVVAEICRKMGWTYQEFLNQPDWLIDTILTMESVEAKVANSNQKGYNKNNGTEFNT